MILVRGSGNKTGRDIWNPWRDSSEESQSGRGGFNPSCACGSWRRGGGGRKPEMLPKRGMQPAHLAKVRVREWRSVSQSCWEACIWKGVSRKGLVAVRSDLLLSAGHHLVWHPNCITFTTSYLHLICIPYYLELSSSSPYLISQVYAVSTVIEHRVQPLSLRSVYSDPIQLHQGPSKSSPIMIHPIAPLSAHSPISRDPCPITPALGTPFVALLDVQVAIAVGTACFPGII